jgi:hypothetical protein
MNLEKINGNIKWYRENKLKIKLKDMGEESEIWVMLDGYNICFKLIMFDFVERIKEDLMLNVSIKKVWNNQRVFVINSGHALELVNYILEFINEWDIKVSTNTISDSDFIPDNLWYE